MAASVCNQTSWACPRSDAQLRKQSLFGAFWCCSSRRGVAEGSCWDLWKRTETQCGCVGRAEKHGCCCTRQEEHVSRVGDGTSRCGLVPAPTRVAARGWILNADLQASHHNSFPNHSRNTCGHAVGADSNGERNEVVLLHGPTYF